jgi:hypothetical protein
MLWQDYFFSIGSLVLALGLVPSLVGKSKPAFWTSLISGSVLIGFGFLFYTLSLWASASTACIQGVFWFILAYQKLSIKREKVSNPSGATVLLRQSKRSVRTAKNG